MIVIVFEACLAVEVDRKIGRFEKHAMYAYG